MSEPSFYNPSVKDNFLQTIRHPGTREAFEYTFKKTAPTEWAREKDMFEMNEYELEDLLYSMSASTVHSAYNYAHRFHLYYLWAIHHGLTRSNIPPFSWVESKREWSKQFVAFRKNTYFTRADILDMCDNVLVNYPDKALLLGLFEGIAGPDFADLLRLRISDLYQEGASHVAHMRRTDGSSRIIPISSALYGYMERADRATSYLNKNGTSDSQRSGESLFVDSPYIFKKLARGRKDGTIDGFYVRRKFKLFQEVFGLRKLTAKEVVNSGLFDRVHTLQTDGVLTDEQWLRVATHYAIGQPDKGDQRNTIHLVRQKVRDGGFEGLYGYLPK